MKTIAPETETEGEESDFKPLTAKEAEAWRQRHPSGSVWRLVFAQAIVGIVFSGVVWLVSGRAHWAWSIAYGALAVVLPAALFARGVERRRTTAGSAMAGFFVWEMVKIVLTIVMLAAAPRVVPELSWLALLVGMVATMKTYWIALLVRSGVRKTD